MMGVETAKIGAFSDPLILVSTDFTPSDFSLVDKSKILAIISEKGSQTSHTAILARSLGVPCIVGISNIVEQISSGEMLLVDGYKGKVIVNPSESTLGRYTEVVGPQAEPENVRHCVAVSFRNPRRQAVQRGNKYKLPFGYSRTNDEIY